MADRKVIIEAKVKIVLIIDEGVEVAEVMSEVNLDLGTMNDKATCEDATIEDYEIVDSK